VSNGYRAKSGGIVRNRAKSLNGVEMRPPWAVKTLSTLDEPAVKRLWFLLGLVQVSALPKAPPSPSAGA
jgi:hypothetical protein